MEKEIDCKQAIIQSTNCCENFSWFRRSL